MPYCLLEKLIFEFLYVIDVYESFIGMPGLGSKINHDVCRRGFSTPFMGRIMIFVPITGIL